MRIADFITSHLILPRLRQHGVLVVYDAEGLYRELYLGLASEHLVIVDASASSIESRDAARHALQRLGMPGSPEQELLVYVPTAAPLDDEARQRDPFALYAACGAIFPDPTNDGERYESLCRRARPDDVTAIRCIFSHDPNPSFAVIDAVGGGTGWPNLQAVLGVESAREILTVLLAPDERQRLALKGQEAWVAEMRELFQSVLGLKLITRAKSWEPIADELWRFIVYCSASLPSICPLRFLPCWQTCPAPNPKPAPWSKTSVNGCAAISARGHSTLNGSRRLSAI